MVQAENIESVYNLMSLKNKTYNMTELSSQEIIDCSQEYGNDGCEGGYTISSFEFSQFGDGLNREAVYPYEGKDGKCR